ncbi:MAG: response regulator, partial [Bacteroidota bacterium]
MSTLTILVVDDETDVQHLFPVLFRRQIRKKQYRFLFAASGQEALDMLGQYPGIDLMLCDIDMPGMSGLELLETLQTQGMELPVIMVSAHRDKTYVQAAMEAGAYDYV